MTLTTIFLLGSAQAAFLVALIAGKASKTLADFTLAAWIFALGLHHLLYALHHQQIALPSTVLNLNAGVPLLQGPFLFLYVDTLTSGRRRLRLLDSLHFIPYLGFAGYVTLLLPRLANSSRSSLSIFDLSGLITAAILLSVPAYALVALRRLRRHGVDMLDRYSEQRGRDLAWLRRIVLALLAVWGMVVLATVAPPSLYPGIRHQMLAAVTLFIYAIGYFGWRQFAVVEAAEPEPMKISSAEVDNAPPKYERSGLKKDDLAEWVTRLESHLERHQPFLEPGVTLMQVAADLQTTPNRLSQAINQGLDKNFHELINERRVEAFKDLVLHPRNQHRNLLAIAFDSGFSSKSSFNRVFKQLTGMSPRQYVESQTTRGS